MSNEGAPDFAKRIRDHAAKPARPGLKRFYEAVSVTEEQGGFGIALDRRALRTPAAAPFVMPGRALAEAVAGEWAAQGKHILPDTMPLTKFANTAIDRAAGREAAVAAEIAAYGACDMLCYRAETPETLAARQAAAWDPPLRWFAQAHGSSFVCVSGLVHRPQPAAALDALARKLERQGPFRLAALHAIATLTGSAILALALVEAAISADAAWAAAHVEEDWQIEQWGSDAEAEARRAARRFDFDSAVRLLELL